MLNVHGANFMEAGARLMKAQLWLKEHTSKHPNEYSVPRHHYLVSATRGAFEQLLRSFAHVDDGGVRTRFEGINIFLNKDQMFSVNHLIKILEEAGEVSRHVIYQTYFLHVGADGGKIYGQDKWFGDAVFDKFPTARDDVAHAANCLAVREPTACVLHLVRALEAAINVLAKKLKIKIGPRATWGGILNDISAKIEQILQKTSLQKTKRNRWSEVRVNLYHVKSAWRDESMHGRRSWTMAEAEEITASLRVFMRELTTL